MISYSGRKYTSKENHDLKEKKNVNDQILKTFQYKCPECDFESNQLCNLLTHFASVHYREELKKYFGNSKGLCKLCSKVFPTEQQLLSHLANKHKALRGLPNC